MANDFFTKDDFVKKGKVSPPWYKNWKIVCLVIVCVVLATIFVLRGCTNGEKPVVDTLVTDSIGNDSVPPVVVDSVGSDSIETTPKVVEDETISNPVATTEVNKPEESKSSKPQVVNVSDDVEKEALSVIRGNYGNNPDRRRKLKDRYQEIQNKVNEMYRNGRVK